MGKRITSLQEITTVTDNDFIPVDNQSSGARKLSAGFLNDIEDALDGKQDALTAGANINIAQDGTISATDTTYTAGTNVDITNGVISATDTNTDALSELTDTAISSPSDGQTLIYDSTSGKWVNGTSGSGGGTNLFGTTDPSSSLGINGDTYMKYIGGDDPIIDDQYTTNVWSGDTRPGANNKVAVPNFDLSQYYYIKVYTGDISGYTFADIPVPDIGVVGENNPYTLSSTYYNQYLEKSEDGKTLYFGTTYTGTATTRITKIDGRKVTYVPPEILNIFGKIENEWVDFPKGVESVNDLNDVDITTPTDGQVLSYDATNQEWVNADAGSDVNVTQIQSSGTKIATVTVDGTGTDLYAPTPTEVVANPSGTGSTDLTKIDVGGTIYNIPTGGSGSSTLAGLIDVDLDTPTDGQGLVYDATNQKWVNDDVGGGSLTAVEMDYEDWLVLPQSEREDPTIEYFLSNAPGGGTSGGGFFAPDYENPETITLVLNTWVTYNVTQNGYMMVDMGGFTGDATTIKVNNTILSADKSADTGYFLNATYMFPVMKDDVVELYLNYGSATYASNTALFFPARNGGGGTGDLSAMELTQNQYNNLPTTQKLDDKELYFINNNITTEEVMDVTDFVNKVESGGAMTITADATNNTLTYVWGGAATIGANSFYPTVIPSNVTRIDYKITTGTSYTTSDDQFKIGIGVKTTYDATNWAKPTDNNWVAIDTYNTQNTVIEGSLDLSEVDEDTYFYICGHGWNMTIEDLTIVTVNESTDPTKIMYKDVEYGNSGGSSGGGNLYGTTNPTSDLGSNGDIYMKYQGGSEPVESDYETVWSGTATVTSWGSPYTFPFDVTKFHKLKIGDNEKLVSELKTYSYLVDHQDEDEWWIIRDFPAAELCLSDEDPTKLQLYGQSGYSYTLSEIQGTTMELHPPQILNVFGKVEDEWVGFPGYSEKVLWSGSESISQNASPFSVPDSSYNDISEYDEIQIEYENGNGEAAKRYSVPVEMFKTYPNEIVNPEGRDALEIQRSCTSQYSTADNCIKVYCETSHPIYIKKIIGVKRGESNANSSASLYKWYTSNDGTITVRTGSDGVYWFFNGFNTDGGGNTFVNIPSELAQFAPTNTEPQLSEAYSDPSGSTVGWIGFYLNTIRGWNLPKSANLFTTLYGVVKADGANEQHNGYFSAYKGIPNSGGISYSTAEQVVGTWIDGKPLYQKTIGISNISSGAWISFLVNQDSELIELVNGYLITTDGWKLPFGYRDDRTAIISYILNMQNNNGTLSYVNGYISLLTTLTASMFTGGIATLRYTKTTD